MPFPADRGAGKYTFTSFLQETGRNICGKSEKDRIYIRDSRRRRICCIDDNEEALLWRLRMIGTAKESIVLSTFDLRADDNGTKFLPH